MVIRFPIRQAPAPAPAPPPAPHRPISEYGPGTDEAEKTAATLESLAERPETAGRESQLRSLAGALRDPDEARGWREIPLHAAFANLAFTAETRTAAPLRWLHMARAAAVFLPLLVSWLGIHGAVDAYRERLAADPDQGAQTFFREWLGGFDGDLWLSFDRMAAIVVASIAVLIAVAVAVEWLQRQENDQALATETELRDRLDAALTEAALHLRLGPAGTPEDAERQLKQIVARSADLIEALLETVESVRGELTGLEASTGEFRTVIAGLQNGAKEMAAATAELDATVAAERTRAVDAFATAGNAVAAQIAAAADDLQTGMADQQQRAMEMLAQVGQAVTEAVGEGERHRDAIGLLMRDNREDDARALAEAITSRQGELADELRKAGEDIAQRIAEPVSLEVDPALRQQLDAAQQTNLQLHTALEGLAQSVEHLGRALGASLPHLPQPRSPRGRWFRR